MSLVESAYKQFDSSMPWLRKRTVLLTRSGSHAYGLNTAQSDEDFKGFCIPTEEYFHGFVKRFEQAECKNPDLVIYSLSKFFTLAADCNPSIIEVLYTEPEDRIVVTPAFEEVLASRDLFLSRKARHTFSGYAISQLKRIQRHYEWLHNPPKEEPTRAKYGLPERTTIPADQRQLIRATVNKRVDQIFGLLDFEMLNDPALALGLRKRVEDFLEYAQIGKDEIWKAAAAECGLPGDVIDVLMAERAYNSAREQWSQYLNWKATRNPARAELEAKYGYDTKHGMHLVRLMRMGEEILTTGKVIVKRPDREELLAIRNGEWSYERLVEWATARDLHFDEAEKSSPLPRAPDRTKLDKLHSSLVDWALVNPWGAFGPQYG